MWMETARVLPPKNYADYFNDFQTVPCKRLQSNCNSGLMILVARALGVLIIGAVCGSLLIVFGMGLYVYEDYHRKRFYKRIYID